MLVHAPAHRDRCPPQVQVGGRAAGRRSVAAERLPPDEAARAVEQSARLVDIRPQWQRREEGEIPGALIVERNHLEWRLHPDSDARVPQAAQGQRWVVVCSAGYTSSLAADALNSIGVPATDLAGGYQAWAAAGLPTVPGGAPSVRLNHTTPDLTTLDHMTDQTDEPAR